MTETTLATHVPAEQSAPSRKLLNVKQVADLLDCSDRHVYRLVDSGRMPRPVKLGGLNRWPTKTIEDWITADCPAVRKLGRG